MYFKGFSCQNCGSEYPTTKLFECDRCGSVVTADYDYEGVAEKISRKSFEKAFPLIERFEPLLPIEDLGRIISIGEGNTPLLRSRSLAERLGAKSLSFKDETRNPTWTFKDRAICVGTSSAKILEKTMLITASTGNAGASLSAYSAKSGLKCVVLAPEKIDPSKLGQILIYGGKVVRVKGGVDDALSLLKGLYEKKGWYPLPTSAAYNPRQVEGAKTIAYEICVQTGWETPEWIIAPIGGGDCVYGVIKGFEELQKLGLISQIPAMIGVQAEGCAPLVEAFKRKSEKVGKVSSPDTIASSIRVAYPPTGNLAMRAIRRTGGLAETVSDSEMLQAQRALASSEGIFAEPASASVVAALMKISDAGVVDRGDKVLCVITGTGLKQLELANPGVKLPEAVEPSVEKVIAILDSTI